MKDARNSADPAPTAAPSPSSLIRDLAPPLVCLVISVALVTLFPPFSDEIRYAGDIANRYDASHFIINGFLPYRDFGFEYPPLLLLPILAPLVLGPSLDNYIIGSSLLGLVMIIVMMICVRRIAREIDGNPAPALLILAISPIVLGPIPTLGNADIVVATLMLLAGSCLLMERSKATGLLLGFGGAMKATPIVSIPIVFFNLVGRREWKRALQAVAASALVLIPAAAFVYLASPERASETFALYGSGRPPDPEGLAASVLLALGELTGTNVTTYADAGLALSSPLSGTVVAVMTLLGLAGLGWAALTAFRLGRLMIREDSVQARCELLIVFLAAAPCVISFGRWFSPQYAVAFLVLAVVALVANRRGLALVSVAVLALTHLEYPYLFNSLLDREPAGLLVSGARNLLAGTAVVVAISGAWRVAGRSNDQRNGDPALDDSETSPIRQLQSSSDSP